MKVDMRLLNNSLPLRFAVVSFVTLAAIIAVFVAIANEQLRSNALDVAIEDAVADLGTVLYTAIMPSDFTELLTQNRYEDINVFIRNSVNSEIYSGVGIWSARGVLLYRSDTIDLHSGSPLADDELARALQGEASATVLRAGESAHGREPFDVDMIEIHIPRVFSGVDEPLGAFEIYQPYAPTADRIASTTNLLYLAALVGFALIYTTSVTLVWYVSRVVRRQQTALTDAYTELAEARNKLESRVEGRGPRPSPARVQDAHPSEDLRRRSDLPVGEHVGRGCLRNRMHDLLRVGNPHRDGPVRGTGRFADSRRHAAVPLLAGHGSAAGHRRDGNGANTSNAVPSRKNRPVDGLGQRYPDRRVRHHPDDWKLDDYQWLVLPPHGHRVNTIVSERSLGA